jgi:hypothetical protein
MSLMQLWEEIGFIPGANAAVASDGAGDSGGASGSSSGNGGFTGSSTALAQYCFKGSLQAGLVALVKGLQQEMVVQVEDEQWLQQLLGACLSLHEVPYPARLAEAARAAAAATTAGRPLQQQAGAAGSGVGVRLSSERLQQLSAAAVVLPGTSAGTLLLLSKAEVLPGK